MCEVLSAWHKAGAISVSAILLFYTRNSLCDFKGQVGLKLAEAGYLGRSKVLNITREFMV